MQHGQRRTLSLQLNGPRGPKAYHSIKQWVVGRAEGLRVGNADPYALQKERERERERDRERERERERGKKEGGRERGREGEREREGVGELPLYHSPDERKRERERERERAKEREREGINTQAITLSRCR